MNTPGYEQLAAVLQSAYDQAATGKGAERHADNKPFHEQPMQTGSDLLGTDAGLAFQAIKKVREGSTFAEFGRFEREMLGAINYIAGMVIWRRRQLPATTRHQGVNPALGAGYGQTAGMRRGKSTLAQIAARHQESTVSMQCPECGCPTDDAGTHYATCSGLTAPEGFVEQVEQVFDELEGTRKRCPGCGVEVFTLHEDDCPLRVEPAFEPAAAIDDESPRAQAIGQNGNDGEHYDDPWYGAPEWAKYKAQDKSGYWFWYEVPVFAGKEQWCEQVGYNGRLDEAGRGDPNPNWRDTLIQRP